MKKIIVLFLMLVLSSSAAHAGFFDWVTGMVANDQEEKPSTENLLPTTATNLYEQVTCKFLNSTSTQTCYASNTQSCSGTDSCTMAIMGTQGSRIDIKACGGAAYATIDSADESVEFNCETRRTKRQVNIKCVFDEATQTKICDPPEVPNIHINLKEQVTCKFLNSTSTHICYYPYIQDLSCSGTDSCTMTIEGREGSKVEILACG